jgi:transmembrane sensor
MGMSYPTAREEQAAYWYLKLQEPHVSAEDIQAALAWEESDPENRAALERVEAFWRAWPQNRRRGSNVLPKPMRWRSPWQVAAAAVAVLTLGLWLLLSGQQIGEPMTREYGTAVGQVRTVRLDDGTEVVLGGATSIRATFAADTRRILMMDGEALFLVAKDARRPFIVDVPNGSAQALGTTFNVHRAQDEATVTVVEGVVQVDPPSWGSGGGAKLHAGNQVSVSKQGTVGRIRQVDPTEMVSWRSGRMVFVDRTLSSVVADLNRYSTQPITLAATAAAATRVSGSVKLADIESWLHATGPVVGVEVVETQHGIVLVPGGESRLPAR